MALIKLIYKPAAGARAKKEKERERELEKALLETR